MPRVLASVGIVTFGKNVGGGVAAAGFSRPATRLGWWLLPPPTGQSSTAAPAIAALPATAHALSRSTMPARSITLGCFRRSLDAQLPERQCFGRPPVPTKPLTLSRHSGPRDSVDRNGKAH